MISKIFSQFRYIKQGRGYKNKLRQLWEFFYYFLTIGLIPREYNLYNLGLKTKTKAIINNYLSTKELNKLRKHFNYGNKKLLLDKLLAYQFFTSHKLPTPDVLACCRTAYRIEGVPYLGEPKDIIKFLKSNKNKKIVIKPSGGTIGAGIIIIKKIIIKNGQYYAIDAKDREIMLKNLISKLQKDIAKASVDLATPGFIVQEYVQQHNFLKKIYPDVLNTFRIVTLRKPGGKIAVDLAILRTGGGNNLTDNWSRGGLSIGIDIKTHRLKEGIYKPGYGKGYLLSHPRTGTKFSGLLIPNWKDILNLAQKAASSLPQNLNWIGWDIVLTDEGPLILEGNCNWDIMLIQVHFPRGAKLSINI